ncbi:MAG: aspartyl/glutamyl-tRNA(Asn/Gln) amidotransferase subunit C [Betaproteobacteria bacterium TMED156]|nr:MAG: aspartyl/glutamyl-tRNA(Asn/Gln) amidotransferase subunit C [Betaproteobacteria bacterium TMED156]|tara:strand:+ start:2238 stop:2525 length:288 start_codon:yes stop_codon:yes gene_type:complete
MQFQSEHVKKLAKLSKLSLEHDEVSQLLLDLSSVINWVDILKKVNTDNLEPMFHPGDINLRLRKDQIINDNSICEILLNAPEQTDNFFIVPRVVD